MTFIIRENTGGVNCGRADKTVKNRGVPVGADSPVFAVCGNGIPADTPTTQGDYTVEAQAPSEKPKTDKVNINTADADELDALPGIGPVLAQRIIDWRTANGPFTSPEDLLQVSGIGQTTLDGLRDRITTEETQE